MGKWFFLKISIKKWVFNYIINILQMKIPILRYYPNSPQEIAVIFLLSKLHLTPYLALIILSFI